MAAAGPPCSRLPTTANSSTTIPDLVAFFQQVIPDRGDHKLQNFQSSAAAQGGPRILSSLRAIPGCSAGTQMPLSVPSWFGVGAALQEELDSDPGSWSLLRLSTRLAVLSGC